MFISGVVALVAFACMPVALGLNAVMFDAMPGLILSAIVVCAVSCVSFLVCMIATRTAQSDK